MSILTEAQIADILDGAMEHIRKAVIDEAIQNAAHTVQVSLSQTVTGVVREFVKEELAPEIVTSLRENRSALIEATIASAESMAVQLATAMSEELAQNLGSSYKRKKVLAALFD